MTAEEFVLSIEELEDALHNKKANKEAFNRLDVTILVMSIILGFAVIKDKYDS